MRFTQGIYSFLARNYSRVLHNCTCRNRALLMAAFLICPAFSGPAQAASVLEVEAQNGSATIANGGVWSQIKITQGQQNPTNIEITGNPFTLLGLPSQGFELKPLVVKPNGDALTANITVNNTSFNLGSATSAPGGEIPGNIALKDGSLAINGAGSTSYMMSANGDDGRVTVASGHKGIMTVRAHSIFAGQSIGSQDARMTTLAVESGTRLQITENIFADKLETSGGSITSQWGDINIISANVNQGAQLNAAHGNIRIGAVSSESTSEHWFQWSTISAPEGSIYVSGTVNVGEGLTNMVAGDSITFVNGDIIRHNYGDIYLKAGGNVLVENGELNTLNMEIKGAVNAASLKTSQMTAAKMNIVEDALIAGESITLNGSQVEYGRLKLTGPETSQVGGNLGISDSKLDIGALAVGGSASLNRVDGKFGELTIKNAFTFDGGDIEGSTLTAPELEIGGGVYSTSLKLDKLVFDSLKAGTGANINVETIDADNGEIAAAGASITVGSAGSRENPLASLMLHEKSAFLAKDAIFTRNLGLNSARIESETGEITASGDRVDIKNSYLLADSLSLGSDATIGSLSGAHIAARGQLNITGNFSSNGASFIESAGDINITGRLSDGGARILDITAANSIQGEADVEAGTVQADSISLKNLSASAVHANRAQLSGDLTISGGSLYLAGTLPSVIQGNVNITGQESSYFENMTVGGTFSVDGAQVTGKTLTAAEALVSGNTPTTLSLQELHGANLGVGANALVSIGEQTPNWLARNGGAEAVLGLTTPVRLAGLVIDGQETRLPLQNGQFNFTANSMLVADGLTASENNNPQGLISATATSTAQVDNGAKLRVNGVAAEKVYIILGDNITTSYQGNEAWEGANISTDAHLLTLQKIPGRNGSFIARAASAVDQYPGLDGSIGGIIDGGNRPSVPITPITPSTPVTPPSTPVTPDTPSQPSTPDQPSNPGDTPGNQPSNPGNPSNPSNPSTPGTPNLPSNPGTTPPTVPDNPGNTPSTPDQPSNPGDTPGNQPSNPGNPSNPSNPSTPGTPNQPSNPGTTPPTVPDNPGNTPSTPDQPSKPGDTPGNQPSNPGNPSNPSNPSTPGTPNQPSNPGTTPPDVPDNPGDTPSNPDQPSNPGEQPPDTPDEPEEPDEPNAPEEPSQPAPPPTEEPVQDGPTTELGTEDWHYNSPYAGVRFLSRVTSAKYMDHNYGLAATTMESAARMAILGAVPQMAAAANSAAFEGASHRISLAESALSSAVVPWEGEAGHRVALWLMPLYKNTAGYGLHANNFSYDFNGGLGGVALGGDWSLKSGTDIFRIGLDFNMGGGYAQSGGDLAKTTNSMGFWGAGIYAAWLGNNFGISADAHFTATWNTLKQELPASLEMKDFKGELTASAVSTGLRAEYAIPLDNWLLTPHAGARYMHLHTDNYSFYSDGAAIDGSAIDQSIWTFPVGIGLSADFAFENGWAIRPKLDFSVIPAAGNMEARTTVQFTGTSQDATLYTQTMDYISGRGAAGVEFTKGDFSLGAEYAVQAGAKTVQQSVFGLLRYEF